jgi:hypothetical protein
MRVWDSSEKNVSLVRFRCMAHLSADFQIAATRLDSNWSTYQCERRNSVPNQFASRLSDPIPPHTPRILSCGLPTSSAAPDIDMDGTAFGWRGSDWCAQAKLNKGRERRKGKRSSGDIIWTKKREEWDRWAWYPDLSHLHLLLLVSHLSSSICHSCVVRDRCDTRSPRHRYYFLLSAFKITDAHPWDIWKCNRIIDVESCWVKYSQFCCFKTIASFKHYCFTVQGSAIW